MTIAGKKFDRYLLPALTPLILIAGWGWTQLAARVKWLQQTAWRAPALLIAVVALQLASALPTFPYYLSYYNPLLGGSARVQQSMMVGWGEGLDQAADYLNQQPNVQPGDAAAWYSVSFNLLTSAAAEDIPIKLELTQAELEALLAKEYLVIYVHQWQRGTPQNLLDALEDMEAEHRVVINGIEYVRVYHLNGE
jgi:4-amino-4-deoxy-L-arabinose transferase-like glycosyltransferase